MSKTAEEYHKEFDAVYGDHKPNLSLSKAQEAALKAYPHFTAENIDDVIKARELFAKGYSQAEKDIKEAIIKHFKYKQDHSPEHTLHWWVYKNVIDKVNEL